MKAWNEVTGLEICMEETLTQAKLESDEKHQGRLVVAKDMKSCFPQSNTHYGGTLP